MKYLLLALALTSGGALAATHEIKMLDNGLGGNMVFEPAFVKAEPGDTITFKPVNTGHWVQSKAVPPGATEFLSQADKPFSIKLEKEGVYVYTCPPHRMMNMSGVIQVGKPVNQAAAQAVANEMDNRAIQNKGRLKKLIQQVK